MSDVQTTDLPVERFYTIKEVADMMRTSPNTVRREIYRGNLAHVRFGHQYRIGQTDIDAYRRRFIRTRVGDGSAPE